MSVTTEYLNKHRIEKTVMYVYLTNKTRLFGCITACDDDALVIDDCLVIRESIISVSTDKKK